jgi:hypothetical protein
VISDHKYGVINLVEFDIEYNERRDMDNNKILSGRVPDDTNRLWNI